MQGAFKFKATERLRGLMGANRLTAPLLAKAAGVSQSVTEKVMAEVLLPGPRVAAKIEAALGVRIWSTPFTYRRNCALAKMRCEARAIVERTGVSQGVAIARVLASNPSLKAAIGRKRVPRRKLQGTRGP